MFPIIGLLGAALTGAGGYALYWYESLNRQEREEADRLACDTARQLYGRALTDLLPHQAQHVLGIVRPVDSE